MAVPRVILADDHPLILEGIKRVLDARYQVVGTASNGQDLLKLASDLRPDIAILDIAMPSMNGIEAARRLAASVPATKIVFVTQMDNGEYVRRAFECGASAFILKQAVATDLLTGLRAVSNNLTFVSAGLTGGPPSATSSGKTNALTPRQIEVLRLIAEGLTAKEIASALGISARTVDFHKAALLEVLGVRTTAELIRYAVRQGIVT